MQFSGMVRWPPIGGWLLIRVAAHSRFYCTEKGGGGCAFVNNGGGGEFILRAVFIKRPFWAENLSLTN